ncbi:protein of unknown function DUF1684 [Xylanimonas cellulosilytica DSM 15894]|uniref:DUF1684 domain-containing protein n=1 Tax=Xylanimonas cellulosilytica (strain DSM 15894 / JCM 12276 / CECT 5975 / KCTC 9989 / LMG 20990 / NBRC 107835 / XIL07) TaxID=446471 RepID=D1BXF9_XYLCX|nr:DUF1684 domain-containing protein [Xylanimonas cellulosilytica]ACZ29769.1 protein of unknown function DUF1684 [Xylanimonas cellulosilytica DSM 15894]
MTTSTLDTWTEAWQAWHADRVAKSTAPHGIAAAVATHWLTADSVSLPELPGAWAPSDEGVVGTGLPAGTTVTGGPGFTQRIDDDGSVLLRFGAEAQLGELRLRAFVRVGDVALRVSSPAAPARARLAGIDAYAPDPDWVVPGRFVPAGDEQLTTFQSDGTVVGRQLAGRIEFVRDGQVHTLLATAGSRDLFVTFSDVTSGSDSAPFRFLGVELPDDDGSVTLDFNRAYLPPATFSSSYSCPLPPRQNRLPFEVRAGERTQLYKDGRG